MKWLALLMVVVVLTGIGLYGYKVIVVRPREQAAALLLIDGHCKANGHKGAKAIRSWNGTDVELYCIRQDNSLELIKVAPAAGDSSPAATAPVPTAPPSDSNTGIVENARAKWDAKCATQGGRVSIVQEGRKNKAYCRMPNGRMDFLGAEDR